MFEAWQLRAAREAVSWSQSQLARHAGTTQAYISDLENGKNKSPGSRILRNIETAFNSKGIYFTPDGLQWRKINSFVIEGPDVYLRVLDDVMNVLRKGEFFLKSCSDERRSSEETINKLEEIRSKDIGSRSLVRNGDTFLMGHLHEYRWMDDALFTDGDVKLIYADRTVYLASWADIPKAIVIHDEKINEEASRIFEYIWDRSQKPTHSDAKRRFKRVT